MAWCPFAVHKPISKTRSRITPRAVIAHTAVSNAASLFGYFSGVGDDSHFYVGPNGELEQYVDTEWSAYANRDANNFAISFESWDNRQIIPWTLAQLSTVIKVTDWCCDVHPTIPRRQIESAYGSGLGWHAMWGAPSPWTKAAGKVCPGGPRIGQMRDVVIPRVAAGSTEDDMDAGQDLMLRQIHEQVTHAWPSFLDGRKAFTLVDFARNLDVHANAIRVALDGLSDDEAKVIAAVRDGNAAQTAQLLSELAKLGTGGLDPVTFAESLAALLGPELGRQTVDALAAQLSK